MYSPGTLITLDGFKTMAKPLVTEQTNTCSKSTTETLEEGVKYVQS